MLDFNCLSYKSIIFVLTTLLESNHLYFVIFILNDFPWLVILIINLAF